MEWETDVNNERVIKGGHGMCAVLVLSPRGMLKGCALRMCILCKEEEDEDIS